MHRIFLAFGLCGLLCTYPTSPLRGQQIEKDELAEYRTAGLNGGDPTRGKILFAAARIMQDEKEPLARLLTREEGKALKDARAPFARRQWATAAANHACCGPDFTSAQERRRSECANPAYAVPSPGKRRNAKSGAGRQFQRDGDGERPSIARGILCPRRRGFVLHIPRR